MRWLIVLLVVFALLVPIGLAHSVETAFVIKNAEGYNVKFSATPKFPVVHRAVHIDLEIWDDDGEQIETTRIVARISKDGNSKRVVLERERGHYTTEYVFDLPGEYQITPIIDDKKLDMEFVLDVDSFGVTGALRAGVAALFLLILLILMYKDIRR